jgi:hypothetical protein
VLQRRGSYRGCGGREEERRAEEHGAAGYRGCGGELRGCAGLRGSPVGDGRPRAAVAGRGWAAEGGGLEQLASEGGGRGLAARAGANASEGDWIRSGVGQFVRGQGEIDLYMIFFPKK